MECYAFPVNYEFLGELRVRRELSLLGENLIGGPALIRAPDRRREESPVN